MLSAQPDLFQQGNDASRSDHCLETRPCVRSGSATMSRTLRRGLSDCCGILKDDLHLGSQVAQFALLQMGYGLSVKEDFAGRRFQQPQDQASQRRLATTRLADQAQRRAAINGKTHVIHCVHVPTLAGEPAAGQLEIFLADFALGPVAGSLCSSVRTPHPRPGNRRWHVAGSSRGSRSGASSAAAGKRIAAAGGKGTALQRCPDWPARCLGWPSAPSPLLLVRGIAARANRAYMDDLAP